MAKSPQGMSWWLETIGRIPRLTPAQEIELGTAIQAWRNHPDPACCPPAIRRRGERAQKRFIEANLRLAVSYVTKRCHRLTKTYSQDDLIQAANLGLITAVERFDPSRGYRFSTYAYWWIRQSVSSWADRNSRAIAIPQLHAQHLGRLGPIHRRLSMVLGREPSRQELAAELNVSERTMAQLLINAQEVTSLDRAIGEVGEISDVIGVCDVSIEEQEAQEEGRLLAHQLAQLLQHLPPRDRQLVADAYGLDGVRRSRQEVAEAAGISVRRLESILLAAVERLREMAQPEEPFIAVGVDASGAVRWQVISASETVMANSGARAVAILEAMRRARGLPT